MNVRLTSHLKEKRNWRTARTATYPPTLSYCPLRPRRGLGLLPVTISGALPFGLQAFLNL